jgi:hypothetical protein
LPDSPSGNRVLPALTLGRQRARRPPTRDGCVCPDPRSDAPTYLTEPRRLKLGCNSRRQVDRGGDCHEGDGIWGPRRQGIREGRMPFSCPAA